MDIKILLLISYNALIINERYYAASQSLESDEAPHWQNGNRRLYTDYSDEDPDLSYCFPRYSVSSSLEEKLDPHNNGLQRLVVYLYLTASSDQVSAYIPNHDKQAHFPSLKFEQGDVLQNLTDKEILKNNTNISILINNTSPQPTDKNASVNESSSKQLRESSTKTKNLQSSNLLDSYNSKQKPGLDISTEKPIMEFQIPHRNSRSNLNENRLKNLAFDSERPNQSPLDYNDREYEFKPLSQSDIKNEKRRRPAPIGFNRVPQMISQFPKVGLNLSQIVSQKNNIVHFTRNNQTRKTILQPNGMMSPLNSRNEVSDNMIRAPAKFNIKIPQSHNTILLHKGLRLPQNLIRDVPSHFNIAESAVNLKTEPNMVGVRLESPLQSADNFVENSNIMYAHSNLPNSAARPVNLGIDKNIVVPPYYLNVEGKSDNLKIDLNRYNKIQIPPNLPSLSGRSVNLGIDDNNIIIIPANRPNVGGRSDNLKIDLNKIQVPPKHPNLLGTSVNLGIDDENVIIIPSNHLNVERRSDNIRVDLSKILVPQQYNPNLPGRSVNLGIVDKTIIPPNPLNLNGISDKLNVDLNKIQIPSSHSNLLGRSLNLGIDENNIILIPANHLNVEGRSDNIRVDLNKIQVPPNHPNLAGRSVNLGLRENIMHVVPRNHLSLKGRSDNLRVDLNRIQIPPNRLNLAGRSVNSEVDSYGMTVPPNYPSLEVSPNNFGVNPSMIQDTPSPTPVGPNSPDLGGEPDNLDVDLNIIDVHPNQPSSAGSPDNYRGEPYMTKTPSNTPQLLRMNNLFSDWLYNQMATANQELDVQINIDTLKSDIIKILARYNMYISEDGCLIDSHGNILNWNYLQLRIVFIGDPIERETVINHPDFEPSNTDWKALLTTIGPSSQMIVLDIIPLRKIQLIKKSDNVPTNRCICTSEYCRPGVVPVQSGDQALLAKLQNYMQIRNQHLNIEQLLNRRKVGLKLDRRKEPLQIYDKYKAYKGRGSSKKEAFTKSGRREKDPVIRGIVATEPRTPHNLIDWRIIGGAAATSSGAPISIRGRSGYIF